MNQEVYNKCRKKARRIYKKTKCKKKDLWNHVKNVKEIAKYFCKKTDLNKEEKYTIYLGCILHDIGKTDEVKDWYGKKYKRDNHHTIGKKYLEEIFFPDTQVSEDDKKVILEMVKKHKDNLRLCERKYNGMEYFAISLIRFADEFANKKIMMIDDNVYTKE